MEVIKLNLIPGKACPVVHVSQFDDGRDFKAELYEGVNVYTLDGTETLTAIVKKPDGNEVTVAVTNTSDDYVIITTTEQMTACAGGNLGTLRIEKGAVTIGTLNFILECQASPDTGIQSDSEIHNLEAQVNQMVEDAVAEQYDSNNVLFDTAPTSGHGVPYAVTSGGLWSWLRDLPLRAYPTASGAIATFDTSLALPLQDCTIGINAVQESGTPTPQDSKAISGFTGANIYDKGVNLWDEVVEDGYINASGVDTPYANGIRSKNYMPCTPNTTYCYVAPSGLTGNSIAWYDINKTFIQRDALASTNTSPANAFYFRLSMYNYKGTYPSYANNVSLNYPATDTAYHAYNANSTITPITWQDEAGTVYGGSLDVTSGVLTVTHGSLDLSTVSWNTVARTGYNLWYSSVLNGIAVLPETNAYPFDGLCSTLEIVGYNNASTNNSISLRTNGTIYINNGSNTVEPTGLMVYKLITPQTYQLTPTQISAIVGTNNIFCDTGDTSVVYACSLKDYIDGQ